MLHALQEYEPETSIQFHKDIRFHPNLTFGERMFFAEVESISKKNEKAFVLSHPENSANYSVCPIKQS